MEKSCRRCNPDEAFKIPHFSLEEKRKLLKLKTISALQAIREIRNVYVITLKSGKFMTTHMNPTYKVCHHCQNSLEEHEYTTCSTCGSLNFNWNV